MNKLESNHDLFFNSNLGFLGQFSSGIEYCEYEQQIDLSISFLSEEKPKTALVIKKIKQILTVCKKGIGNCNRHLFKYQENQLVGKSQLLLKKISTDTAWVSSLLALTSVGIVAEIAPIWSAVNQNLSLKLPLRKNVFRLQNSVDRLFPLLAMSEIDLVILGHDDAGNWQNQKSNKINDESHDWEISAPIQAPVNQQEWLMYPTKINGSLMAIPLLQNQPSVAGFPSLLSTLDTVNIPQDSNLIQFSLLEQNILPYSPSDSVTYHLEDSLMAIPKTVYQPYLPKIKFLDRNWKSLLR